MTGLTYWHPDDGTRARLEAAFPTFLRGYRAAHAWWYALPAEQRTRIALFLQAAALLLFGWRVWRWYFFRHRGVAIGDPDAEDYAQVALQMFLGRGMGSRTMPLCGLEYLSLTGGDPAGGSVWPNLHRFPFMALVDLAMFHRFGATDRALSSASGIFYIASVPLVFLLGRRVFGTATGLVGALLYTFSPLALGSSITGLTEQATSFFMLAVVLLLTGSRGRPALVLAGLLWGISFWNRYTGLMLALPFSIYLWSMDRKRAPGNIAAFLIPMALAMVPEILRNVRVAGDPMFSLTAALMVPYKSAVAPVVHWWYVPVYVKPSDVMLAWPGAMMDKWLHELYGGWRYLPQQVGLVHLYPFLLLALFLRAENVLQRRLRILVLALVSMHEMTLPFLSNIVRYYAYLSPLLILFATWGILTMAHRVWPVLWPAAPGGAPGPRLFGRALPASAVLAVLAGPMLIGWINLGIEPPKTDLTRALVDTWRSHMRLVKESTAPDEVVVCNAPWSIAWRADRKSVPLPAGPSLVPLLAREYGLNIGAVFLTPRPIGAFETPNRRAWEAVRGGRAMVRGFRRLHRFHDGAILLVREGRPTRPPAVPPLLPEER